MFSSIRAKFLAVLLPLFIVCVIVLIMTGPSVSGTTGKLISVMAYPILENGKPVGAVYGTVKLDSLLELVGASKYMETGYVYVADQSGLCIGYKQMPDAVGKLDLFKTNAEQPLDQRLVDGFNEAVSNPVRRFRRITRPARVLKIRLC